MNELFVPTNGIQLHAIDHAGGEPTLVLLPGLTANANVFDGLIAAGLSPRFRALALDLRGRGLSDKPDSYTLADHAADVIGLLDALDLATVVPVGHSFGGLLSLYLAAHYPQRIPRFVLIDSGIALATVQVRDQIKPSLDRLGQVLPSWEAYLAALKAAPYFDGWWDERIESYFRADVRTNADGTVQAHSRPEHIAAAMEGVITSDWRSIVHAINQPALLLHATGAYGPPGAPPILSAEQARATAEQLPDCRSMHVPGNHLTMLYGAGADEIAAAITAFVAQS